MNTLLELRDVHIRFGIGKDAREVVSGLSISLERGSALGIVGESGSGKSVSALSIMGLLPNAHISGNAFWHAPDAPPTDLYRLSAPAYTKFRGRSASMIFQEPMTALNPVMRCGDQIAEILRDHHLCPPGSEKTTVLQWLEKVRINQPERIFSAYPHEISGGQKQRILIAMAMAAQPELLIADEPTTALDVQTQKEILDLLQALHQEYNLSLLFISHDLGVVSRITEHVIVMHQGKVMEAGPTQVVLKQPQAAYTRELLASRPSIKHRLRRLPTRENGLQPVEIIQIGEETARRQTALQSPPALKVQQISAGYPSGALSLRSKKDARTVLYEIDFDVKAGESFGIVGESGSGKTTLAKCLAGQLSPSQGSVLVYQNGRQIASADEYRKTVQMVYQDPYSSLNPRMPVGESILEPLLVHHLAPDRASGRHEVDRLLNLVGLKPEDAGRLPHAFSGGQRQRICIARALAMQPSILICDEVTSALDVRVQATVLNLLADLQQELGLCLVFISHDLSVIRQMCDRLLVLRSGRMDALGYPTDLFHTPPTAYVQSLLDAVLEV